MNADDSPAANSADGAPQAAAKAAKATKRDQPYFDPVAYGNGPDDSIAATEATRTPRPRTTRSRWAAARSPTRRPSGIS